VVQSRDIVVINEVSPQPRFLQHVADLSVGIVGRGIEMDAGATRRGICCQRTSVSSSLTMSSRVFVPEAEEPESAKIEGGVPAESGGDGEVQFGEVEVGGDAEEAGDGRVERFAEG